MGSLLLFFYGGIQVQAGINEWTYVGLGQEEISEFAVHPTNPDIIYASGLVFWWDSTWYGGLFKTTDRGLTWDTLGFRRMQISDIAISRSSPETVWIAAGYRGAWRSTDGGETWEERSNGMILDQLENVGPRAVAICPQDQQRLVAAFGSDQGWGGAYYSTNEGESWLEIDSVNDLTNFVEFDPGTSGMVWLGAEYFAGIWQSSDFGRTFGLIDPDWDLGGIHDMENPRQETLWYVAGGHIKVTTDAGHEWDEIPPPTSTRDSSVTDLAPVGRGDTLAVDTHFGPYITYDGGQNWQSLGMDALARTTRSIWHVPDDSLLFWSGRWQDGLWAITVVDTITSSEDRLEYSPSVFSLSQNFPNPFNPTTEIQFSLSTETKTTLRVFDLLGREVVTLVNRVMTAGEQRVLFDASELSSGIYFYRLSAGGISEVKKMVVLK